MGSDQHLYLSAPLPPFTLSGFLSRFYDRPLPSSHSKELGQSRWLVITIYPLFGGQFLIFSTYTVVCLFHVLSYSVCLDYVVPGYLAFVGTVGIRLHILCPPTRDACHQSAQKRASRGYPQLPSTCSRSSNMTSESGRNQILAKWQEAFTRLNGNQPGITGLMNFTKVRGVFPLCLGIVGATCM